MQNYSLTPTLLLIHHIWTVGLSTCTRMPTRRLDNYYSPSVVRSRTAPRSFWFSSSLPPPSIPPIDLDRW